METNTPACASRFTTCSSTVFCRRPVSRRTDQGSPFEVEGFTSIRYDIVSLLVTGSEKALLRHHKNILNDGR